MLVDVVLRGIEGSGGDVRSCLRFSVSTSAFRVAVYDSRSYFVVRGLQLAQAVRVRRFG
jgi:hypothetical protein